MSRTSVARIGYAARFVAAIAVAAPLLSDVAIPQPARPPQIALLVTTFFGVQSLDVCTSRVRTGLQKAGLVNITTQPDGFKGEMLTGDNAGISSVVACSASGSAFILSIASAGGAEGAPNSQNARLLAAITKQ